MPRVRFTKDYNHRWASRAISAFKAGYTGPVKAEVWDGAKAKGAATLVPKDVIAPVDERTADIGRSAGLARSDDAHDVGTVIRNPLLDGSGK